MNQAETWTNVGRAGTVAMLTEISVASSPASIRTMPVVSPEAAAAAPRRGPGRERPVHRRGNGLPAEPGQSLQRLLDAGRLHDVRRSVLRGGVHRGRDTRAEGHVVPEVVRASSPASRGVRPPRTQ